MTRGKTVSSWITFARHSCPNAGRDANARAEAKRSLFTRLAAVEVELHGLIRLVAGLKADHDAMRKDRDEWRWRAERLLADQARGFLGRLSNRVEADFGRVIAPLRTLVRALLTTILQAINRSHSGSRDRSSTSRSMTLL
jgi:hypothetical protein